MTFKEYITNPSGIGTAVMSYRKMYEDLYQGKWKLIMTRENGKIDYTIYKTKDAFYFHIKIPSELVDKFYYDVVVKIKYDNTTANLENSEVQFFSNDPSFNYTFAHAFAKHKLHIKELEPKMSKYALHNVAKEKNPQDTIGYVKSLYFAYIVIKEKGLFNKLKVSMEAKQFIPKIFLSTIEDTDKKVKERTEAGEKLAKQKKKESKKATPTDRSIINPEVRANSRVHTVNLIGSKPSGLNNVNKPVGKIGSIGKNKQSIGRYKK